MLVTLCCRKGWQGDRKVFETMKQVISTIGKLADERPEHIDGYMAERPEMMRDVIRVWAPCGCCLTYMSASASVLSQCENEKDDFSWALAEEALNALRRAEDQEHKEGVQVATPTKLEIIKFTQS